MKELTMEGVVELDWQGVQLVLLPEHVVWWPAERSLFLADPHFGKAATFRSAAVPIPDDTASDLQRLSAVIQRTNPTTVYILGDLLHARQGRCPATFAAIHAWREQHCKLQIKLIIGNHDRRAGLPPPEWRFECLPEPLQLNPFALRHHPNFDGAPAFAGHLHPKLRIITASDRLLAPCFLLRNETLVLPAFGSLIDHLAISTQPADRTFIVADETVLPFHGTTTELQCSKQLPR